MMKKNDAKNFALYKNITKQQYDQLRSQYGDISIDDETICFVSDTGKIYTQGYEFGGQSDTTYTAGTDINISNRTISLDRNSLLSWLRNQNIGNNGSGTTYTAGRGITINSNVISANMSDIKNDINLGLQDLTNVQFPSTVSNGDVLKYSSQYGKWINGHDDTTAGEQPTINVKTEAWFKNSENNPGLPSTNNYISQGWSSINQAPGEGQDTWMIIITFQNNVAVSITGPINITHGTDSAFSDGEFIEFIYKLYDDRLVQDSLDSITTAINLEHQDFQNSDYIPAGWTDQPTGISPDHKYEYASYRLKINGVWDNFVQPYLLSAYGEKGLDGDGVEYIFCVTEGSFPPADDPSTWTSDQDFDTPEYIRNRLNSIWKDDPVDMSVMNQGTHQWVSMRKYDGATGHWVAYSSPALWSSVGKDGVAGGYTWKLINEVMAVGTGTDDTLDNYISQTGVQVFNNGQVVNNYRISWYAANLDGTGFLTGAYRTDGVELDPEAVTFSVLPSEDYKILHVSINNLLNFANGALVQPVDIEILNTNNEVIETLHTALTIVGVKGGKDGQAIDLKTSVEAVHADYLGNNRNPNMIDVWALLGTLVIKPTQQSNFYFAYSLNGGNTKNRFNTDSWSPLGAYESVTFYLYYKEGDYVSGNEIPNGARLIDYKQISVIKDGAPAIGPSQYSIEFLDGNLEVGDDYWSYEMSFKTFKKNGDQWNEIKSNQQDSEQIEAYIFGDLVYPIYVNDKWYVKMTVSEEEPESKYAVIYIKAAGGTVLQSLVIPIVRDGVDGVSPDPVQGLQGTVMRFTYYDNLSGFAEKTFYDGETEDNKGIKYLDVVCVAGDYYYPVQTGTGSDLGEPSLSNSNWAIFNKMSDAAFNNMIANNAYIKSLTSEQVVITRGSGNETEIVAGMANERYLNGAYNSETGEGNTLGLSTENGVRIWAGLITNGNVASAPFTVDELGLVKMITALFGDRSGLHMKINGNNIEFHNGYGDDSCIARFVTEGLGLQLHIKNTDGTWYKIDFTKWSELAGGVVSTRLWSLSNNVRPGVSTYSAEDVYSSSGDGVFYYDVEKQRPITDDSVYYKLYKTINAIYTNESGDYPYQRVVVRIFKPVAFNEGMMVQSNRSHCAIISNTDGVGDGMYVENTIHAQLYSINEQVYGLVDPFEQAQDAQAVWVIGNQDEHGTSSVKSDFSGSITDIVSNGQYSHAETITI